MSIIRPKSGCCLELIIVPSLSDIIQLLPPFILVLKPFVETGGAEFECDITRIRKVDFLYN